MPAVALCLASASPRRLELLARVGLRPCLCPAHTAEHWPDGPADAAAVRVAEDKLQAAWTRWGAVARAPHALWLAADTAVVARDRVLGKPADNMHAAAMLRALSGRTHEVVTGFVLGRDGQVLHREAVTTEVTMRPFGEAELLRYVATGEPFDKAGAYAVQGLGGALVERLVGSLSNVVGLPLHQVLVAIERLGGASAAG